MQGSNTLSAPSMKAGNGMRKGTKSCLECRKRKVKCIFSGDDASHCVACKARGSRCTEQRKVHESVTAAASTKASLEERVAQLEALIKAQASGNSLAGNAILNTEGDAGNSVGHHNAVPIRPLTSHHLGSPESTESRDGNEVPRTDAPHTGDPLVSLFDNPIWRNYSNHAAGTPLTPSSTSELVGGSDGSYSIKAAHTCAALLKDLPSSGILAAILNATCSWWNTWRTGGVWLQETLARNNINTLQELIVWSLSSSDPAMIAIGILAIAISLQQLDTNFHQHILEQLPRLPGELFQIYYDRVERLIINDAYYSSSRAGIEVIIMSAKISMNLGLLKRTWILIHRAISHAQILGLHRPQRSSAKESDQEMASRHQTWFRLCDHDMYTSLLLGLPYAADSRTVPVELRGFKGSRSYFQYRLIQLSAKVIDRDQMGLGCSIPLTQEIQQELELAVNEVSYEFWDAPTALHQGRINREEYMECLAAQFWYSQLKVLLHQPLMIQCIENHQLENHRNACLNASRKALRTYHLMRSDSGKAFSMVKVVDYQAFICSALLLLGLLGYGNPTSISQTIDQDKDWEMVQSTLEILRQASKVSNNSTASQAVQGLETLSALVRAGKTGQCAMTKEQCKNPYAQIVVPGSGTITILPSTFLRRMVSPPKDPAIHPPPIFHLSHGLFQPFPVQGQQGALDGIPARGYATSGEVANQINAAASEFEIPSMDFDWTNMINMNTEDDWAWLSELNGNELVRMT